MVVEASWVRIQNQEQLTSLNKEANLIDIALKMNPNALLNFVF